MGRRSALLAGLVAVALAAIAAWRWGAALTLSLGLAAPAADSWIARVRASPLREEISIPAESGPLAADLYRPARHRGALLLVHGLSRAGRRQPDMARLASLLGQHGVLVVVPQFEGLAAFNLSGREVADIRSALRYTAGLSPSSGVAGFSFGAGPMLLAAADVPGLRVVASFGGYADLTHVIRFVTTGEHSDEGPAILSSDKRSTTAGSCSPFSQASSTTAGIGSASRRSDGGSSRGREMIREPSSRNWAPRDARCSPWS